MRPCVSYNDCPTYSLLEARNRHINLGECKCGVRKYAWFRNLYWKIYPLLRLFYKKDDQEWVMRVIDKR